MRRAEITRAKRHVYVDMSEHTREELGIPARTTKCRQPIVGGGSCLFPADDSEHLIEEPS